MISTDYISNREIQHCILGQLAHIRNECDKEDCQQDIYCELYACQPYEIEDAIRIIYRVAKKYHRRANKIASHETALVDKPFDTGNYQKRAHISPWDNGEYPTADRINIK